MLEHTIRLRSEALARALDRRTFLRRSAATIVSALAALALRPLTVDRRPSTVGVASASPRIPTVANCAPPGPYCNLDGVNEPNGCRGASCFQHVSGGQLLQCRVYY